MRDVGRYVVSVMCSGGGSLPTDTVRLMEKVGIPRVNTDTLNRRLKAVQDIIRFPQRFRAQRRDESVADATDLPPPKRRAVPDHRGLPSAQHTATSSGTTPPCS